MSVWQSSAALLGRDGELVSVSIKVEPRDLEALLDALAQVSFPVNPQIRHAAETAVDFPAYAGGLAEVRGALFKAGFDPASIRVTAMLEQVQAAS